MTGRQEEAGQRLKYLAWLLIFTAALTRTINALGYRPGLGFDSVENVQYIEMLMRSWVLPTPDAAWATSHPPLFYYLFAALGRGLSALGDPESLLIAIPLVGGLAGLFMAGLAASMVRRFHPGEDVRAFIALFLVLFLPVQIYLSAMVNEEILAALFTSLALWVAVVPVAHEDDQAISLRRVSGIGVLAGLAILTKLSGILVLVAIASAWMISGWRARRVGAALRQIFLMCTIAMLIGGWFYLRNYFLYGYFYPQDLELHAIMFDMPPGSRGLLDYLFIPLATWTDPQLLNPDLLGSVWGSTYATLYFDGHRHFLPHSSTISAMGSFLLVLGILPLWAFLAGFWEDLRRSFRGDLSPALPLMLLTLFSLAGYTLFTFNNPWFATLKASYLLGLSIPFAWYASQRLALWVAQAGALRFIVTLWLATLGIAVTLTFTTGLIFEKIDGPGLPWQATLETP